MALSSSKDAVPRPFDLNAMRSISDLLMSGCLESPEQIRRFELLRLAFFALKLRKLELRACGELEPEPGARNTGELANPRGQPGELDSHASNAARSHYLVPPETPLGRGYPTAHPAERSQLAFGLGGMQGELEFRCSLLRHVIFQQVLTLIKLDARQQALQIIEACRK